MTSRQYTNDTGETKQGYPPPPTDCDPDELDHIKCEATGIEAQAAYIASKKEALATARTAFEGARKTYGKARETAEPLVEAAKKQLDKLVDQLICLIDDTSVTSKLDVAYDVVGRRLDECSDQSGCYCQLDCDFDEMRRCPDAEVRARIADIEALTKAAEDCFNDLIQEPTKLAERVTAVQAEITDIQTKIAAAPDPANLRRLYAAALVARRHLKWVWRGFTNVNAYIDCLCQAFSCMLRGHAAIADLKRRLAVAQCHQDADAAACEYLRENTVDEVLAAYLKIQDEAGGTQWPEPPAEGYRDRPQPGYEEPPGKPPAEGYRDRPQPGYEEPPGKPWVCPRRPPTPSVEQPPCIPSQPCRRSGRCGPARSRTRSSRRAGSSA